MLLRLNIWLDMGLDVRFKLRFLNLDLFRLVLLIGQIQILVINLVFV